jgi:hypothetical protein
MPETANPKVSKAVPVAPGYITQTRNNGYPSSVRTPGMSKVANRTARFVDGSGTVKHMAPSIPRADFNSMGHQSVPPIKNRSKA